MATVATVVTVARVARVKDLGGLNVFIAGVFGKRFEILLVFEGLIYLDERQPQAEPQLRGRPLASTK